MSTISSDILFEKYKRVKYSLRKLGKVGVAFSGGIDSSLTLLAAGETLGKDNVTAIHGRSVLNILEADIEEFFYANFENIAQLTVVDLHPLSWPDFVTNDSKRCYYCKSKTYSLFHKELSNQGVEHLVDGTNFDDLQEPRAGLAVLNELGVKTPLADAEINKKEVRFLAQAFNLPNYYQPSNSCLATRLFPLIPIHQNNLDQIALVEKKLHEMGFTGCRVRPAEDYLVVELRQQDYSRFIHKHNREELTKWCEDIGFKKVLLDIRGRF